MELSGEERLGTVSYPFVGAVVHIDKVGFPVGGDGVVIHCESVILGSDVAAVGARETDRLVMAAVAIFQFINLRPGSLAEKLITHADAADRFSDLESLAYILHSFLGKLRRTGAVADEETVVGNLSEIIIPWNERNTNATPGETTDDVVFCAAIDEHHPFFAISKLDHLLGGNTVDKILLIRIAERDILTILESDFPEHRALFAQEFCKGARVDAIYTGDLLILQPIG